MTIQFNKISIACLSTLALVLTACGGGSSGGAATPAVPVVVTTPPATTPPVTTTPVDTAPPTTIPPVTTPPVVTPVVVPPTYTISPGTLEAAYVAGYPAELVLSAKQTVPFVGISYTKLTADADVIDPAFTLVPTSDGGVSIKVKTSATAKPGNYAGNITINVCADPNCASPLAGSPFKLPYAVEVIAPTGGVQSFSSGALAPLAGASDWETFQSNAAHTGYVPVTLDSSAFKARWKLQAPSTAGVQIQFSDIATGGGRIYTSNGSFFNPNGTSITAYSEADGSKVWTQSYAALRTAGTNPPAYSNGRVYTVAGSQESTAMYSYDGATGTQLFKTAMSSQWEHYLAPTVFNGNVYSDGGSYGGLYSFSATSGAQNYFTQLDQYDGWTPSFDGKNLYTYMAGFLKIHDPLTGKVLTTIADPLYSWNGYTTACAPVIGGGGIVYAGNLSNSLSNGIVAFDTIKGSVRWSAAGGFSGNPAYADGYLFTLNNNTASLEVRREGDGVIDWVWNAPATTSGTTTGPQAVFASDVLLTKNLVFVSTKNSTVAIDRASHAAVWSYKASGKLALSANGILYIKSDSAIVAISLK